MASAFNRCPWCNQLRCRRPACAELSRVEDEIDAATIAEREDEDTVSEEEIWADLDEDEEI